MLIVTTVSASLSPLSRFALEGATHIERSCSCWTLIIEKNYKKKVRKEGKEAKNESKNRICKKKKRCLNEKNKTRNIIR